MAEQTQCIRCGKSRVLTRTWNEQIGLHDTVYTQNVCPDFACQKVVELELKEKTDIFNNRMEESLKRRKENRIKSVLSRKVNMLVKRK